MKKGKATGGLCIEEDKSIAQVAEKRKMAVAPRDITCLSISLALILSCTSFSGQQPPTGAQALALSLQIRAQNQSTAPMAPPFQISSDYEALLDESDSEPEVTTFGANELPPNLVQDQWPSLGRATNQSGATASGQQEDYLFMGSFFSHIDKQWNFAEVILIIVISTILNLVTIVGNIMVLISFKMDRS